MRAGRAVPGYGMEPGQAREGWIAPLPEVTSLGDVLGVELRAEAKLLTPTQARAALKRRALDPTTLDAYAHRPQGALKFAKSSPIHARKVFTKR